MHSVCVCVRVWAELNPHYTHTHTHIYTHSYTYISIHDIRALFKAVFEQGIDISSAAVVAEIAEETDADLYGIQPLIESTKDAQTYTVDIDVPGVFTPPAIIVRAAGSSASFPAILGVVPADKIKRVLRAAHELARGKR